MDKVFRNVELKGVISKKKALELLGDSKLSVIVKYHNKDIVIYVDDNYNVNITLYDTEFKEVVGGYFEEI